MTDRAVIAFPTAVFEGDDLLVLALLDDFAGNRGAFDQGGSVRHVVAVAVKKHIRENAFFADLRIEEIDVDDVTLGDAVLATACSDNCEMPWLFLGKRGEKFTRQGRFDKWKGGRGLSVSVAVRWQRITRKVISPFAGRAS